MGRAVMTSGLLISLEGIDGVGKTTQIERICAWLRDRVDEVLAVREPGGTPLGEALRELILQRVEAQSSLAEFLVFAAARAELVETVVLPALARGAVVVMDRFIDSSVSYQAFGHGLAVKIVDQINRVVVHERTPDLTIWLKGDPFPMARADRVEERDAQYYARVEQGYQWLVQQEPQRWLVVDSRQSPDEVFGLLQERIETLLNDM
ncbi:MAG: dTMP kinase [Sulfobacillus acidophilus]|uniref:Thymidylate kinase n=1 Tax=Sulfobacillus acidophilus TaxID=53633 RepID=A0A2T2WH86_9FIRM|nr:MAG: dTMP kinase [Sulfobacillus acidophilus]